jgi:hypothetical protein
MTEEDEEFNRIEREAGMRKETVKEHMTKDEALKLALEWYDSGAEKRDDFEAMIRNILAPPKQEPVAWSVVGDAKFGLYELGHTVLDSEESHTYWKNRGYEVVPLYTAPPQRPWVGLTEDEIESCWDGDLSPYQMQCIKEIEAKLREKNT